MRQMSVAMKTKLVYVETFGCQMNVNDTEKILALLKDAGYHPTADSSCADLVILNTCSVRAKAEQKVYNRLVNLKGLKGKNRRVILGVGGCVAQQEGARLMEKVPFLDLVFGTHNLHKLPDMVRAAEEGERLVEVGFIDNDTRLDLFPATDPAGGVTRFVTVMQGCENFCSYCIVPYVRGPEISRRAPDIIREIRELAEAGVREVTLLGQNVNSYGLKHSGKPDFPGLLRAVAAIPGIDRIRFTTSHPKDISPDLIDCFARLDKLCSHIHLPAQSGSDAVLKRMNRGYTRREYLSKVAALRAARPDIQITGDMIVGFPGESVDDFGLTLSLMDEVGYADLFYFIYSPRPETRASLFVDGVSQAEKQERLGKLREMQRRMTREQNLAFVGTRQQVLVEGPSKQGDQLFGRTSGNRAVNFAAPAELIGRIADVTITKAYQNSLLGEIRGPGTKGLGTGDR
jgi:tRNA-2-methylthio-N6-dimethylallyladenosine synthase